MKRTLYLLIFLFSSVIIQAQSYLTPEQADRIISGMNSTEKLSLLFAIRAYPGGNEAHFTSLESQVGEYSPGAVFFENGSREELLELRKRIDRKTKSPVIYAANLTHSKYTFPKAETLMSCGNEVLINQAGAMMANDLHNIGVDLVLDRRFETGSSDFMRLGSEITKGLYVEGVFPVQLEDHKIESRLDPGIYLVPGKDPLIDRKKLEWNGVPSYEVRKKGFTGLLISTLDYPNSNLEEPERALYQLKAGADMLYRPIDLQTVIPFLKKAIRKGELSEEEIDKKVKKILMIKWEDEPSEDDKINNQKHQLLTTNIYRSSISLLRNEDNLLPLQMLDTLEMAFLKLQDSEERFSTMMKRYAPMVEVERNDGIERISPFDVVFAVIYPETSEQDISFIEELSLKTKVVAITFTNKALFSLSHCTSVVFVPEKNEITIDFTPQLVFGAYPFLGIYPSSSLPSGMKRSIQTQTMQRLAYTSPMEAGMDKNTLDEIAEIAKEAIYKGAAPGMQILAARHGKVVYQESFGYYTYAQKQAVTENTIYDLASVTKVLATLQAVQFMYDKGLVSETQYVSNYLAELKGTNKESLVLKDVLLHQAGLKPWMPFWRNTMSDNELDPMLYNTHPEEQFPLQVSHGLYGSGSLKDSVWGWIVDSNLLRLRRGEKHSYRYSDMGFYMMQQLSERILNQPLNEFVAQNFYSPLGMTTTGYLPLCQFDISRIPPTADDPYFRKQLIKGVVHDEGAAMFGGVAGHSGLFSSANDLAKLLQMHLNGGVYGGEQYLSSSTIDFFTQRHDSENRRGLGWDKPRIRQSDEKDETLVSEQTFGHTGFTGTAVWVDPENDLIYIFLSNRIHPDAENGKLMSLNIRSRIQEKLYESIQNYNSQENDYFEQP